MEKRLIPTLLIIVGIIAIMASVGISLHPLITSSPQNKLLPTDLAGIPLNQAIYGPEAITGVIQLHGVDFPLEDAALGSYSTPGEITIWASVEPDDATATDLLDLMTEKINLERSPFTIPTVK